MNLKSELFRNQKAEILSAKDLEMFQYFLTEEYFVENDVIYSAVTLDDLVLLSGKSKSTCSKRTATLDGVDLLEIVKKITEPNKFILGYIVNNKPEIFYIKQLILGLDLKGNKGVPENLQRQFNNLKPDTNKPKTITKLISELEYIYKSKTSKTLKVGYAKNGIISIFEFENKNSGRVLDVFEYMLDNRLLYKSILPSHVTFAHFVKFFHILSDDYDMFNSYPDLKSVVKQFKDMLKDAIKGSYKEMLPDIILNRKIFNQCDISDTSLNELTDIFKHYVANCLSEDFKFIHNSPSINMFVTFFTSIFWHYKGHTGAIQPQVEPEHIDYKFDVL